MIFFISNSKHYTHTIVLFILFASMGFFISSEWLIRTQVVPKDTLSQHVKLFLQTDSNNIAFGDSHVSFGFTAGKKMLNLSFPGESLETVQFKIQEYFRNHDPARVLLQADPYIFSRYRHVNDSTYMDLFNRSGKYALRIFTPYHRTKILRYWQTFLQKGEFNSKFKMRTDGSLYDDTKNWEKLSEPVRLARAKTRGHYHSDIATDLNSDPYVAIYRNIIEFLLDKGAQVCIVGFPVTNEYINQFGPNIYEQTQQIFKNTAYNSKVIFQNYDNIFSDKPEYFRDQDHVNSVGARKLSTMIMRDCFGL